MNQSEEHFNNVQMQKRRIRERYRGVDQNSIECLPARPPENIYDEKRELRVAVYARVSTDDPRQTSSYELQKNHYTDFVNRHLIIGMFPDITCIIFHLCIKAVELVFLVRGDTAVSRHLKFRPGFVFFPQGIPAVCRNNCNVSCHFCPSFLLYKLLSLSA